MVNSTNDTTRDRNRVDIWRSKLLDLTLRNKLINFKESSKQAVPLFTPQPEDVENLLAQGKALKLKSLLDLMPEQDPRALEHQARSTQATLQAHLSRQALSKQELLADLDGDQLDKRLTEIFRNARTAQEEGGANTLFLVFGMLQWTDSKDRSRSMRAPMVMVPVTLERQSVNSAFVLRRHDDDTIVNPTLLQLLEHQFELKIPRVTHASELPQDESGVDIAAIWASFRSAVVDLSGFEVIPSVWLGLFSFTKYLMWQDLESILDECLGSGMRVHTLKWHYRSQKESLITFSNHRYYDAQLITFPSPTHPDNGVTFHHVDGVYQRAGARNNRQEAEAVVTFIEQHLQADHPNPPSIGVVTFSQAQQQLIEDLLDAARRKNPVLDRQIQALTNEPLFVKNLENVQGDERGIILFSICYGPDETGRVAMNFGPLSRDGGHRRLNVAITRAKTQIHLFSTLHPDQLDLSRTKARGVADLKHYLQFAIQGAPALVAQTSPTGLSPDSPFEVEVLNHLLDQGWQVHCQVGCSSYRIDLAVVDPRAEGRYLLAIECDGASYHSAATARDRDKLRQMVLERLGWTVHRIWSTEWWTNREREQQRLQKAIQQAMQQAESASQSSALIATSDHQSTDIEVQVNATPAATYASHTPDVVFDAVDALAGPADMQTTTVAKHYVATVLKAADPDRFFEPSENTHLVQMMQQVIVEEGPVIDRIIIKRVIDAYGFKRTGNRIQLRLAQLLSTLPNQESASQTVYWPVHLNPETWCDYREMGERDVADIPVIEMAQCAKQMLMQLVVAEEEALIKTMGNSFGMGRVTRQSQDKLRAGVDLLQAIGQIEHTASGWKLI